MMMARHRSVNEDIMKVVVDGGQFDERELDLEFGLIGIKVVKGG